MLVSHNGTVRLRYSARRPKTAWGIGLWESPQREVSVDRVIRVPASQMERFLAKAGKGAVVDVTGEELRKFARPEPFDLFGLLPGPAEDSIKFSRGPGYVTFAYKPPSRGRQGGGPREAEEVNVRRLAVSNLLFSLMCRGEGAGVWGSELRFAR